MKWSRYAKATGLLVILDGKRNDIGSTAEGYAQGWLGDNSPWRGDALTVSPYLGDDSLDPFVHVARRSRRGGVRAGEDVEPRRQVLAGPLRRRFHHLQPHRRPGRTHLGGDGGRVGLRRGRRGGGATYPEQLAALRQRMPHTWFLVPGYGSQGGTAADVEPAFDDHGLGAVINSSRAIIFAHSRDEFAGKDWQQAVEAATRQAIADLSFSKY